MKEVNIICYDKGFELNKKVLVLCYPVTGDIVTYDNKEYIVKYRSIHPQMLNPFVGASISIVLNIQ